MRYFAMLLVVYLLVSFIDKCRDKTVSVPPRNFTATFMLLKKLYCAHMWKKNI